jgi:hypothetical protein
VNLSLDIMLKLGIETEALSPLCEAEIQEPPADGMLTDLCGEYVIARIEGRDTSGIEAELEWFLDGAEHPGEHPLC